MKETKMSSTPQFHSQLQASHVATRLPAQNLARARKFYSEKLGLEPVEERQGGLRYQCGEGWFSLFESAGRPFGTHTQMGVEVDHLEETVGELAGPGRKVLEYDETGLKTVVDIAFRDGD